jgi:hypothetical protein
MRATLSEVLLKTRMSNKHTGNFDDTVFLALRHKLSDFEA